MTGYGAGLYSQANYNKGVIGGWVSNSTSSTVQINPFAIWTAYPTNSINATSLAAFFGGMTQGSTVKIQGTGTVIASKILKQWLASTDLGVGTSTMYSSGHIAWDGQLVSDTTWTTQTVD